MMSNSTIVVERPGYFTMIPNTFPIITLIFLIILLIASVIIIFKKEKYRPALIVVSTLLLIITASNGYLVATHPTKPEAQEQLWLANSRISIQPKMSELYKDSNYNQVCEEERVEAEDSTPDKRINPLDNNVPILCGGTGYRTIIIKQNSDDKELVLFPDIETSFDENTNTMNYKLFSSEYDLSDY